MPLDANLFVLSIVPQLNAAGWVDLREDTALDATYTAHKQAEKISLIDPYTDTEWASIVDGGTNKSKIVNFCNPDHAEEFKNTGKLGWEWSWEWEGVKYAWDRSGSITGEKSYTLEVVRKPDPNFPICLYTPATKKKPATCQILDYNLARIEPPVEDRKGLEIMTLLTLLSLLSSPHFDIFGLGITIATKSSLGAKNDSPSTPAASASAAMSDADKFKTNIPTTSKPPPMPPVPPRGSSFHKLSTNEIEIKDESKRDQYLARALELLKDDGLLYLVLLGSGPVVPDVVAIAETIKRQRYKTAGEELMQFIDDEPPVLSSKTKYATPTSIKIYLSRIEMRDILPNYRAKSPGSKQPILRPPIVFGQGASSSAAATTSQGKDAHDNPPNNGFLSRFGF